MKIHVVNILFCALSLFSAVTLAASTQVKCTEKESFDSIMMKEHNGKDSEGVLKNAEPNDKTGNIGDYTITFDSETKEILSLQVIRKTSNVRIIFDRKNSTFRNRLKKLPSGSFDGDCTECRTHFELVEGIHKSSGNRIAIKIDDHGVYPDLVASNVRFQIGSSTFDLSAASTTEMTCDGTILLKRPKASSSLEDDLLE